jgi:uncharacterized membrane protein
MNKIEKRLLVIISLVTVLLFLFFGSNAMMKVVMNGKMIKNGWLGSISWWWFSAIVILLWGLFIGWLFYRKRY